MPTEESLRPLDALNARVMQHPAAARLTLMSRILLAVAFIPTGSVKLMGERFTSLGVNTSVGAFFEAMYQTGGYWRFLGLSQVLAGVLLHEVKTAHPIDGAFNGRCIDRECVCQYVCNAIVFVNDIHQRHAVDVSKIVRLPAGRRIEGSSIEIDAKSICFTMNHVGVKRLQVRIGVIQAVSHV